MNQRFRPRAVPDGLRALIARIGSGQPPVGIDIDFENAVGVFDLTRYLDPSQPGPTDGAVHIASGPGTAKSNRLYVSGEALPVADQGVHLESGPGSGQSDPMPVSVAHNPVDAGVHVQSGPGVDADTRLFTSPPADQGVHLASGPGVSAANPLHTTSGSSGGATGPTGMIHVQVSMSRDGTTTEYGHGAVAIPSSPAERVLWTGQTRLVVPDSVLGAFTKRNDSEIGPWYRYGIGLSLRTGASSNPQTPIFIAETQVVVGSGRYLAQTGIVGNRSGIGIVLLTGIVNAMAPEQRLVIPANTGAELFAAGYGTASWTNVSAVCDVYIPFE